MWDPKLGAAESPWAPGTHTLEPALAT